eukprot:m.156951 g.156951  ORF g.156951 m.156951 type:complete len:102 (+) comp17956_c0_seq1:487-792(+)
MVIGTGGGGAVSSSLSLKTPFPAVEGLDTLRFLTWVDVDFFLLCGATGVGAAAGSTDFTAFEAAESLNHIRVNVRAPALIILQCDQKQKTKHEENLVQIAG